MHHVYEQRELLAARLLATTIITHTLHGLTVQQIEGLPLPL